MLFNNVIIVVSMLSWSSALDVHDLFLVHVVSRMEELGIDKDGSVCFGQLLGMCDHVSLTLGELSLNSLHFLQEI